MQTFISILRGINVSGSKVIKMNALQALFSKAGFTGVSTYIQSGNVVFQSAKTESCDEISALIEQAIKKQFGFEVPVITLTAAAWQQVAAANPFLGKKGVDETKLHVTFLNAVPGKASLAALNATDFSPEEFIVKAKAMYLHCPNGYGNARLNNNFIERTLKVKATTRNWRTVMKLAAMAG